MAKADSNIPRISVFAAKESVAIPTFRAEDKVGVELYIHSYEFAVVENGGEKVTLNCVEVTTNRQLEITTFDKAIVAQMMSIPADTLMPIAAKVVKFGRYYALD